MSERQGGGGEEGGGSIGSNRAQLPVYCDTQDPDLSMTSLPLLHNDII